MNAEAGPERPNTAFEIWQDLVGKQREEALREARLRDVEKRFQERIQQLKEMAALPQEQIDRILDEGDQRERQMSGMTPAKRRAFLSSPEELERSRRISAALQLATPIGRSLAKLVGDLTPSQWALLLDRQSIFMATAPQGGELPLPGETASTFRSSLPYQHPPGRIAFPGQPEEEEVMRQREQKTQEGWTAATDYRVRIHVSRNVPAQGALLLNAWADPLRGGASTLRPPLLGPVLISQIMPRRLPEPSPEELARRRAELEKDPVFGARKPFAVTTKPRSEVFTEDGPLPTRFLQDLFPDMARAYGVEFISDAYWTARHFWGPVPASPATSLVDLLEKYASPQHQWDRDGKLIRLRSRTWFLDRPREVPPRLVRRWTGIAREHGALPLEEMVQVATSLTDAQMDSLPNMVDGIFPPELQDLGGAAWSRDALRLYGTLGVTQQETLWQGRPLPVTALLPTQQALILTALKANSQFRPLPLNLAQWTAGSLTLTTQQTVRTRTQRGDQVSFRTEPVPAGGLTSGASPASSGPGSAASAGRSSPAAAPRRGPPVWTAPAPGPLPRSGAAHVLVTRYPTEWVQLHLQLGSETPSVASFTVAASPQPGR